MWKPNLLLALSLTVPLGGCSLDQMASGSRLKPFAESPVFADRRSARPPVPGTVARGELDSDDLLYRGESATGLSADEFPFPLTRRDLERGRERFDIHCAPCHGRTGLGNGMVVQRGYSAPPSYFSRHVLDAPAGHYFQVITSGFGAMPSYAAQLSVRDRWRVAAYIRVLQESRRVRLAELPSDVRRQLEANPEQPVSGGAAPRKEGP
jgi:mono/diheme cytochrome c family protein